MTAMKICAASVATDDYYPIIDKHIPGGNSLNFAAQCAYLGHDASFLGAVGKDRMGDWLVKNIPGLGVDCSHLHRKEGNTASNVLQITGDGERFNYPEDWNGGIYEKYVFTDDDWDFINSHDAFMITLYDPNFREFIKRKKNSLYTTVDCLDSPDLKLLEEVLPYLSAVQFEAPAGWADDILNLSKKYDTVIIHTRNALGSAVFHKGKTFSQSAVPVKKITDTTGCGDTFHATFTCSFLEGKNIADSLSRAAAQASERLCHYGGIKINPKLLQQF